MNFAPEFSSVRTSYGEMIEILKQGELNNGDGPDFHCASIRTGEYAQYGDIELHIRCNDWYAHNHHLDPAYNSVILHVVLDSKDARPVMRQDGTKVPTAAVGQLIPTKLLDTIRKSVSQHELQCKELIRDISADVIEKQLHIASSEYLKQKKLQLLQDYDIERTPSEAWLRMVFLGWGRGLGIPANDSQLHEMADYMWENRNNGSDLIHQQKINSIPWDYSGSRPGNRPEVRIRQLESLLRIWNLETFRRIVTSSPDYVLNLFDDPNYGGIERRSLLLSIVISPALSVLSDITGRNDLELTAQHHWKNIGFNAPYSIKLPFQKSGVKHLNAHHGPGLVYQYKHFCKKKACDDCLIFKNAVGG